MKSVIFLAAALVTAADAMPEMAEFRSVKIGGKLVSRGAQLSKVPAAINQQTSQGCFKSSGDLKFNSTPQYNSLGGCAEKVCLLGGYAVAGTTGGNQCWCGNSYPRKSDLVDDSECNVDCIGYPVESCGGVDIWSIYNTGITLSVKNVAEDPTTSKSSATASATPTASTSKTSETTAATSTTTTTTATSEPSTGGGTNVAGIAAGVVVGVVVIAALIGGGFFYLRRKRNREIEEEYRRNAAVNAFIGKPPGSSGGGSMTDSRMDPVMAHRRMSDGSIADNQDYSRRILRVTNA